MNWGEGMALPFHLPAVTSGYAQIDPSARVLGSRIASGAAAALGRLLETEVRVSARALPAAPAAAAGCVRVGLALAAFPAGAAIEVEVALVAGLLDLLAGGDGGVTAATALTPVESAALELFALAAIDGARHAVPELDARLAPRLVRAVPDAGTGAACVEAEVAAAEVRGRVRVLLPPRAVRALRDPAPAPAPGISVAASLRAGAATLAPEELDALAPGDVVLLDGPPGDRHALVLPGGFRATGRLEETAFHVEETSMPDRLPEIPVTLEVELARFPVTLADLARLEPGAVLTLPIDRRGLVTLRAGEHPVARGELVDVDGAVGVRILSVGVAP
jgi:type III secretion system YscQ/HrcQ family protein